MQKMDPKLILAVPFGVYLASYFYLAAYHGRVWIFGTPIHEGGTYTLLQTIGYASHFLGHIPSLSVIALMFTGAMRTFRTPSEKWETNSKLVLISLAVFLMLSWFISLKLFGSDDTLAYILQRRQAMGNDVKGGAWNLHLPSTLSLLILLPLYVVAVLAIFKEKIVFRRDGIPYAVLSLVLIGGVTAAANDGSLSPVAWIWRDPRYLAHSIRELATFPLTFFPIPLYFILKKPSGNEGKDQYFSRPLAFFLAVLAIAAAALIAYQMTMPLLQGIGSLAQKPSFAHGGELNIPYLLASHYFEHVLDTIYFSLLCALLYDFSLCKSIEIRGSGI